MATPAEQYQMLVERFSSVDGAGHKSNETGSKTGFGSTALTINNKIFAMLTMERLVVKLPARRVDELIAEGEGERFDPGHGRLMKEWLTVASQSPQTWEALADEALQFVGKG